MKSRCELPCLPTQAPPETLVSGSLPSSLCPPAGASVTSTQWVTSLPSGGTGQAGKGRRRAHPLGGLSGAGPGCCRGPVGTAEPGIAPLLRPLDIKGTFPCAKGTPNPSYPFPFSPAPSLSALSLAPPACLGTYSIIPLTSPTMLFNGMRASPEIFSLIALDIEDGAFPAPAGARPFSIAPLSTGEGQLGSQGAGKPHRAEISLFPCPPPKPCAQCSGGESIHRNNQESFHLPPAAGHHLGQLPSLPPTPMSN